MAAPTLAGIVLAAGSSDRLGRPKQLLKVDGRPLVRCAAELLAQLCPGGVTVVTGAGSEAVSEALAGLPVTARHNPDWQQGMASSLHCGLATTDADGYLVMLSDQPLVGEADLVRLINVWQNEPQRPAAAAYAGICGAPAIIPAGLQTSLAALSGDAGAGQWLRNREDVLCVEMPSAAFDIDTPEDLQKWRAGAAEK